MYRGNQPDFFTPFVHLFARRNDDEHPVILLVPEAPTFGGFFYDRKKPPNVGASGTRSITENPVIKPILSLMDWYSGILTVIYNGIFICEHGIMECVLAVDYEYGNTVCT